jgi:hypothetical protein
MRKVLASASRATLKAYMNGVMAHQLAVVVDKICKKIYKCAM